MAELLENSRRIHRYVLQRMQYDLDESSRIIEDTVRTLQEF